MHRRFLTRTVMVAALSLLGVAATSGAAQEATAPAAASSAVPAESAPRSVMLPPLPAAAAPAPAPKSAPPADAGPLDTFRGRPVWWYLIGAALLFATLEWFLYQRRYIT